MPDQPPEIKSSRLRNDWSPLLAFSVIFVPLAIVAAVWSIFGMHVPTATAWGEFLVYAALALAAMAVAAYVQSRRIAQNLESVSNVVWQMSAGEFDKQSWNCASAQARTS